MSVLIKNVQATIGRTYLAFHYNAKLTSLPAVVKSISSANSLSEANRAAFKGINFTDADHVVVTDQTLFHPQGGGQPSDEGTMVAGAAAADVTATNSNSNGDGDSSSNATFNVTAVRMALSPDQAGQVLHLGNFASSSPSSTLFTPEQRVTQHLDVDKRTLYSRYHTAGHVLGSAVRHLLGTKIPNFDETKASHFPDSASCEFQGLIDGTHKDAIQSQVDDFVQRDMPVEIDFWTEEDFRTAGLERLIPSAEVKEAMGLAEGDKFRIVRIKGAEVYPCGGTHVDSTKYVEGTKVKKISRQKGKSKVSYTV